MSAGSGDGAGATVSGKRSKIMVVAIVALILIGSLMWNAWDYFGTQGLSPEKVKEMANLYEQQCYALSGDVKACKRHMGLRHRECLPRGVVRETPKGAPRYDQASYEACMRTHQAEDLATFTTTGKTPAR